MKISDLMLWRLFQSNHKADPEQFIYDLRKAWIGNDPKQQAKDFKDLFLNPQGKRVLYQLFLWGGMFEPGPMESDALQRREGARELCMRVLAILNSEIK